MFCLIQEMDYQEVIIGQSDIKSSKHSHSGIEGLSRKSQTALAIEGTFKNELPAFLTSSHK